MSLNSKFRRLYLKPFVARIHRLQNSYPRFQLSNIHVHNARVLLNRKQMLEQFPKQSVGAELGVDEGNFSVEILNLVQPKKLHLIDIWDSDRFSLAKKSAVENRFKSEISGGTIQIHHSNSVEAAKSFETGTLDWVYIDTDHSFATTKAELRAWQRCVKPGGFLAGHDFTSGNWAGLQRYGVQEAVFEFCQEFDWEMAFITLNTDENPSFALKRIFR